MQLQITLDGNEKPEQLKNLSVALAALYGGQVATVTHVAPTLTVPAQALEHVALVQTPPDPNCAVNLASAVPSSDADEGEIDLAQAAALLGGGAPLAPPAPSPAAAPPSPSAPAAPPATSASTAPMPQPGTVKLDTRGFPWDERIHSSTRATVADGSWKKKRGVQEFLVASVENDYRANGFGVAQAAPAPAPAAPPPPNATQVAPAAPPAPPAGPTDDGKAAFRELVKLLTGAVTAQRITQQQIAQAVQSVGLGSVPELQNRPDLIPQIKQILGV